MRRRWNLSEAPEDESDDESRCEPGGSEDDTTSEDDDDHSQWNSKMVTRSGKKPVIAESTAMRKSKSATTIQGPEANNLLKRKISNVPLGANPNWKFVRFSSSSAANNGGTGTMTTTAFGSGINPSPSSIGIPISRDEMDAIERANNVIRLWTSPSLQRPDVSAAAIEAEGSSSSKRKTRGSNNIPICLVDGCRSDFSDCGEYYKKHKVCEVHSKSAVVTIKGQDQRFCQKCTRFHSLEAFDLKNRSCRDGLDRHNRRRKKPKPQTLHLTQGLEFSAGSHEITSSMNPFLNFTQLPNSVSGLIPSNIQFGSSSSSVVSHWMSNFQPSSSMYLPQYDFSSLWRTDLSAEEEEDVRGLDLNKPPPDE